MAKRAYCDVDGLAVWQAEHTEGRALQLSAQVEAAEEMGRSWQHSLAGVKSELEHVVRRNQKLERQLTALETQEGERKQSQDHSGQMERAAMQAAEDLQVRTSVSLMFIPHLTSFQNYHSTLICLHLYKI
jgi:hypothetical protein